MNTPFPATSSVEMNIFYLSQNPERAARWHCDKHVVKMILETTQLLYTAHWVLAILNGGPKAAPDFRTAPTMASDPAHHGYRSIHNPKHPSAIWVRESLEHYKWLCELGMALCEEFQHRFGSHKAHSCEEHIYWLYANPPPSLISRGWSQPPQAMPEEYRDPSSIIAYRKYYRYDKGEKRGMMKYSKRESPVWLTGPIDAA